MINVLRQLILVLLAKPIAKLVIGVDIVGADRLPVQGPAIVVANHNSHIDTLILLCLYPAKVLPLLRPVAAADHFLSSRSLSWFTRNIVGILPVSRGRPKRGEDALADCKEALARGEILVLFPEGSRGEAEEMAPFKAGVAKLSEANPEAPVVPVYLQGAGRVLPKGSKLFVPFVCSAIIGPPFKHEGRRSEFSGALQDAVEALKAEAPPLRWF